MSVRVLAFFDTRYQSSPELARLLGADDPWQSLRTARPLSRQYAHLNWPSSLGTYDLMVPEQATHVVATAAQAGIDGFVVEVRPAEGRYVTGAEPLAALSRPGVFGLAFRWANGADAFWKHPAEAESRRERARALVTALTLGSHVQVDGRTVLVVDHPKELADAPQALAILRQEASKAGLPGLYVIANRAESAGMLEQGYDAAVDPGPGEWASCAPKNQPSGLDILEIQAGLRDSVEMTDKFYPYALFAITRMVNREKRGKVFPRVFPSYQDWPSHPEGGATLLTNGGGSDTVDRYIYGLFVENAITFAHEAFAPGERLVFLESWNHWLDASQVEPSMLDGDLVFNATRDSIDKGRYMIRTRGEPAPRRLPESVHQMIAQICDAAAAAGVAKR